MPGYIASVLSASDKLIRENKRLETRLQELNAVVDHDAQTLQFLRNRVDELKSELSLAHSTIDAQRAHLEASQGNFWRWQGDGEDFPESLACPVVMSASQLRDLLREKPYCSQCLAVCVNKKEQFYRGARWWRWTRSWRRAAILSMEFWKEMVLESPQHRPYLGGSNLILVKYLIDRGL